MRRINNRKEFAKIEEKFQAERGLPFREILPEEEIREAIEELGIKYRCRIFTPIITLWAFLSQIFSDNCSCEKSAARVRAFFLKQKRKVKSVCASSYCQTRKRLPQKLICTLATLVAKRTNTEVEEQRLFKGREVVVVDGSGFIAPDTPENQEQYPQPDSQKKGCGFPFIRFAVLFSLATGMVLEMHFSPYSVSERQLFRELYQKIAPGTIVLGDRAYCSYCEIFWLNEMYDCDVVFRLGQNRKVNYSKSTWIEKYDNIELWKKPVRAPVWLNQQQFTSVPERLRVRIVCYHVNVVGFRSQRITIVASLLNSNYYKMEDLADLYLQRWQAELNLRTLKTVMKMEMVKGKTPEIVPKKHGHIYSRTI